MSKSVRDDLFRELLVLSLHYPAMRFGQLMAFACTMAGEETPGTVEEVSDEAAAMVVRRHVLKRFGNGAPLGNGLSALNKTRGKLIDALRDLGGRYPDLSTGRLLSRLAALAHTNLYDAEDEELLTAARSRSPGVEWFETYCQQLADRSTVLPRQEQPAYRCPCCRCRTLYERGGFEICPVCYWEDDGQDDEDADTVRGGPNGPLSLSAARRNYTTQGVCDARYAGHVRPPRPDEI